MFLLWIVRDFKFSGMSCCDIFVVEASFGIRNFNMHSALDIGCVVHIRR